MSRMEMDAIYGDSMEIDCILYFYIIYIYLFIFILSIYLFLYLYFYIFIFLYFRIDCMEITCQA